MSEGPPAAVLPLQEADRILAESADRGLALQLAGSAGVLQHCQRCCAGVAALGRDLPRDLDFFAYRKQQRELGRMFNDLGYAADSSVAFSQEYGIDRLIYQGHAAATKIDVFLDVLRMSHTIEFKGRLGGVGPAAPAADLLLSKLQIHEITEKDVKDIGALLAAHPSAGAGAEGGGERLTSSACSSSPARTGGCATRRRRTSRWPVSCWPGGPLPVTSRPRARPAPLSCASASSRRPSRCAGRRAPASGPGCAGMRTSATLSSKARATQGCIER